MPMGKADQSEKELSRADGGTTGFTVKIDRSTIRVLPSEWSLVSQCVHFKNARRWGGGCFNINNSRGLS